MKKYIYLISPQNIRGEAFYKKLNNVLKNNKIKYFQLRLKETPTSDLIKISKKIKKIIGAGHTVLLEKLAEKIFQECFKNKRIETMKIRLEKLDAIKEAASAGIEIERSRA